MLQNFSARVEMDLANCPAVFLSYFHFVFVMKFSWQIQRSQWAIQVGWVGQFTNLDLLTFAIRFYLSPFAENFCKIVFDSFPSLALLSFWPAYDSLASKWKLIRLSTLRLFWSTLRVPIEASHGFQLTDKRRQQDRWLGHTQLPHLSCYSFTKRRRIVTIFFIVKDKRSAAEPKGRGKKHCALLQIFSKVTLTLFLFCTLTDPLAWNKLFGQGHDGLLLVPPSTVLGEQTRGVWRQPDFLPGGNVSPIIGMIKKHKWWKTDHSIRALRHGVREDLLSEIRTWSWLVSNFSTFSTPDRNKQSTEFTVQGTAWLSTT